MIVSVAVMGTLVAVCALMRFLLESPMVLLFIRYGVYPGGFGILRFMNKLQGNDLPVEDHCFLSDMVYGRRLSGRSMQ